MWQNLNAIMAYAKSHDSGEGAKIRLLAYDINVSLGAASHNLRILVKQGKLTVTGCAPTRCCHL